MNDPRFLGIFTIVFILLGLFNINTGLKRLREARARGEIMPWYKQMGVLTGIEYILFAGVFALSTSIQIGLLPKSLSGVTLVLLVVAAVLAGLVIRQSFRNARLQAKTVANQRAMTVVEADTDTDPELLNNSNGNDVSDLEARRRIHRRKVAAARRRRAGKA